MDARPVVLLPLSVGAFAVGPVEPHLHQGTVAGQELLELPTVEIVVPRRVAITGLVAVPGREVQADPESFRPGRLHELADQVAPAVPPGAPPHGVVGHSAGPEAEP